MKHGLTKSSSRHDALLKLCWYYRAIKGFGSEQAKQLLRDWIDRKHNDKSNDYNDDPKVVYDDIDRMVDGYDPDEVKYRYSQKPKTKTSTKSFENKVKNYAERRGQPISKSYNEVEIPSQTLKTFHRNYGPELKKLLDEKIMVKARNYGADIKRCNRYWVKVRHIV